MNRFNYLGSTISSPITIVDGNPTIVTGIELVNESIIDILGTPIGERFFNRAYGSRLHELIFEQNSVILRSLLTQFIKDAINLWETRVEFLSVSFEQSEDKINCTVSYRILSSNEIGSVVYPFYSNINF